MKKKKSPILPIDIKLPELVLLDNGTLFVTLRTLDDLEKFWREHQGQFAFACASSGYGNPLYLGEYEWVFSTTKSALVQTVMRWDEVGVRCEFDDWAKDDPEDHLSWFQERDEVRSSAIEKGLWSSVDEAAYQADCIRRTPESYRGFWQLKGLPGEVDPLDYFSFDHEEQIDPQMPIKEVEKKLQEQIFDEWKASDVQEITAYDHKSFEEMIAYWRNEEANGEDYYGSENRNTDGVIQLNLGRAH